MIPSFRILKKSSVIPRLLWYNYTVHPLCWLFCKMMGWKCVDVNVNIGLFFVKVNRDFVFLTKVFLLRNVFAERLSCNCVWMSIKTMALCWKIPLITCYLHSLMSYYDRWRQILPFPGWMIDCSVGLGPRDWDHSSHLYLQDKELGFSFTLNRQTHSPKSPKVKRLVLTQH